MGERRETQLGNLLAFANGRTSPTRGENFQHPVYGSNGIIGRAKEQNSPRSTIIIGRVGSYCGSLYFANEDCWVTDNAIKAVAKENNDAAFLYYLLRTLDLNSLRAGSGQPLLNQQILSGIKVSVPAPHHQRLISGLLVGLDDKIELNRRMNETLEAMARAIFRDWFVDFGPTRAKMEGRAPYLAPDLWSLFPDAINEVTGLPKAWTDGTLNNLCDLNSETWSAANHPATVAYVDLSNTKWGNIESVEHFAWAAAPSRARRALRPGDTIVGTVRPGNGSYAFVGEDRLTGSTGFAVLRPHMQFDQALVWCAATSSENIERLDHLADGGAYPAVKPDVVAATSLVVANSEVRRGFDLICRPLIERIERNKIENAALAETRDFLLPKLMTGEVEVSAIA